MHKKSSGNTIKRLAGVRTEGDPPTDKHDPYMVREALNTIHRAAEIKRDRPLMREVKRMAKMQVKAVCK